MKIEAGSGVLATLCKSRQNITKTGGGTVYGVRVNMEDMEARGDLIHEDLDGDMVVTLRSTQLTGTVRNAWLRLDPGSHWTATGDSVCYILGDAELHQFDEPAGVTILARCGGTGTLELPLRRKAGVGNSFVG